MPIIGMPEHSVHTVRVRPMIPGARRRGGGPMANACAATGRNANSADR